MKKGIFFGWYVVGLALIDLLLSYGIRYSFGVFFPPMLKEFQWSRALLSGAQSISMLVNAVFAPISGALVDRWGPRWLIIGGAAMVGCSLIIIGYGVSQPWQLYLVYGLILALGINGMGVVVNNTMVTNWFIKKRGLAIAILGTGVGGGIFVLSPISNALIRSFNWRVSFIILGVLLMLVVIPLASMFAKKRPEEIGLKPDGEEASQASPGLKPSAPTQPSEVVLTVGEGLRSTNFWFIFTAQLLFGISWYLLTTHQVAYAIGLGISSTAAAGAFALVGGMSIVGRLFFGFISDRIKDRKYVVLTGLLIYTAGYVILLLTKNVSTLYLFAVVTGFGYGGFALMPAVCGDHFGRFSMGKLFGFISTGGAIGASVGPVLGGYIYDITKSYTLAWEIGIGLCLISAVCLIILGQPLIQKKMQQEPAAIGS